MALKQLVLSRKIADVNRMLEEAREKEAGFIVRKNDLKKREADLEAALNEVTDATTDEERNEVERSIDEHQAEYDALENEIAEQEADTQKLKDQLATLQAELDEINARAEKKPEINTQENQERKVTKTMENLRMKFFRMDASAREGIIAREDVKDFLTRVRALKGETRAVTGGQLTIPDVLLGLLRDNLNRYSKLVSRVRVARVPGHARQTIAGSIPEGVWTEACAKLNELTIAFNQVEVDGYKVGGYVPVCNALLEDSDINLADEIMDMIGQAIGYALDKAILYGTGTKMPIGIATRLAQATKPSDWSDNAPSWTNLSVSNVIEIDPSALTAEEFYSALIIAAGKTKGNYTTSGAKFWAMNGTTYAALQAKALNFNASGAIVSGQNMTMPIVGGEIVILEFMPDNDIIGGYGELYLLAERAGAQFAVSEHVRFIDDQTVFKGTARYDGLPVFGEAFVALNINNAAPTLTATFASDTANP